jgi:hypothetical protein
MNWVKGFWKRLQLPDGSTRLVWINGYWRGPADAKAPDT